MPSDVRAPDANAGKRARRSVPTTRRQSQRDDSTAREARSRPAKRSRVAASCASELHRRLFGRHGDEGAPRDQHGACVPPARRHPVEYHRPLLLSDHTAVQDLLSWFDSVSATRAMPWRQPWIDPRRVADDTELRRALERRAYEVWISEIMLQQTRVSVVVDYWNRWMARWPTIDDLARASADDVLAAWRGLGYYSRASRIHEAAKLVVQDDVLRGLLPASASELEARVPGVGRYTAGAISAIVFGRAEPMVDGNVLRVLSRQLGIYGYAKTDKSVVDTIWAAADALVKAVADGGTEAPAATSDRPGRWGQALMELGSTVCTPKPDCSSCPISSTCRVYSEGVALAEGSCKAAGAGAVDMEDVCHICAPWEEAPSGRGAKGATTADVVADHARRFPAKPAKKAVREEEAMVCAIRRHDGCYLIQRRPPKGLLAGLWQLPSQTVGETTAARRAQAAESYASGLVTAGLEHVGELGSVPWLFSHLKLTMHVHLFVARGRDCEAARGQAMQPNRWSDSVGAESMGTGMRKCWELVQDAQRRSCRFRGRSACLPLPTEEAG